MMSTLPRWLPKMICVDGDGDEVLRKLHQIFETDFKRFNRMLGQRRVWWDRQVREDGKGYEEGFWHLIARDDIRTSQRLFDPRRAERLPWCGPAISNYQDSAVKSWDYREASSRVNTYVWLEALDYVVILRKKDFRKYRVAFLITAYHVDGPSTRNRLSKKFENRVQ